MKELSEYRLKLMEKLSEAANEFRAACLAVREPHATLEDGWSVHQIAVHTRDVDRLVYGLRVRRTALEDNPEFENFDGNVYLAENYDPGEPLAELLNGFVESTEALVEFLRALPAEAWSRLSRHTTLGNGLTLQTWVEKNLAHIREHLVTVNKQKSP
ncbi:MAG TPA: DinB family protein [Anaerolineales bacterium]|nr:DinB family protein [Anaerolineales bacterium]